MNPDLTALYKKQYEEGLTKLQTLSGRLDEIDAAKQQVMPEALKRVGLSNRLPMEDPSASIRALTSIQGSPYQKNTDAVELQLKALAELRAAIESSGEGEDTLTQKELQKMWAEGNPRVWINPKTNKVELKTDYVEDGSGVETYVNSVKNGTLSINEALKYVPKEDHKKFLDTLSGSGYQTDEDQKKKDDERKTVEGILQQAMNMYTGQTNNASDDLSMGRVGGFLGELMGKVGANANVKSYNEYKKAVASTLKSLLGESGVLTNQDIERIIGLLPKTTDNKEEAAKTMKNIDEIIRSKYGTSSLNFYGSYNRDGSGLDGDDEALIQKYKK